MAELVQGSGAPEPEHRETSAPGGKSQPGAAGREDAGVGSILALALAVRIAVPLVAAALTGTSAFHTADTVGYLEPARALLATSGFSAPDGSPEIFRTPGYPLLLTVGLATGHVELATLALQALLGCLTVWLVYLTAREIFADTAAARAAALLYAVEPLALLCSARLLSETLFAAVFMLFALFFARLLRGLGGHGGAWLGPLAVAALGLVASAYVRPIAVYLCGLVPVGLATAALVAPAGRRWRLAGAAVAFAVLAGSPVAAWQARNLLVGGYPGFSAVGDENLYFFKAAAVLARETGTPYAEVQRHLGYEDPEVYLKLHPEQRGMSPARRFARMRAEALEVLRTHPGTYAAIHLNGMLRTLLDPGALGFLKLFGLAPTETPDLIRGELADLSLGAGILLLATTRPLLFSASVVLGLVLLVYLALAIAGLVSREARRSTGAWAIAALAAYFIAAAGGSEGVGRYRHPAMPLVCVLAGQGTRTLRRRADVLSRATRRAAP